MKSNTPLQEYYEYLRNKLSKKDYLKFLKIDFKTKKERDKFLENKFSKKDFSELKIIENRCLQKGMEGGALVETLDKLLISKDRKNERVAIHILIEQMKKIIEEHKTIKENETSVIEKGYQAKFISDAELMLCLLEKDLNEPKTDFESEKTNVKKLKWNCSPSILGFLITELADKGYIEYPKHKTEISQTGLAKLCYQIFEVEATKETLIKSFISKSNQLSDAKKAKFTIPLHDDIK